MSNFYYNGEIYLSDESITVEVHAEASGFYTAGDSWGYGCEPDDGDFEIDEVEYIRAYDDSEDPVEITEEIKKKVRRKLYDVEFKQHEFEPD